MEKKSGKKDIIIAAFITVLYFIFLYYTNLISFDLSIFDDSFGLITEITSIAAFALMIAVLFIRNEDKAFKTALIGSVILFVINPMLGITLSAIMSMLLCEHIFNVGQETKKNKMLFFIGAWFLSVTFVQWVGSFCVQRFYLAEYYSNLHYVKVGAVCVVITAFFVALYKYILKIDEKKKNTAYKLIPILFCAGFIADIFGVRYAMILNRLDMQLSITLTALAITLVKTAKQVKRQINERA